MNDNQSFELQQLKQRRAELVTIKDRLVAELQEVKGLIKQPSQPHVRNMRIKRQAELVTLIARADQEFVTINQRTRDLNVILSNGIRPEPELIEGKQSASSPIRDLAQLRDMYAEFSADKTRVASMRAMAAQFSLELTPIIRALISGKASA